jgi:hypothetical protein
MVNATNRTRVGRGAQMAMLASAAAIPVAPAK